jgi:D-sedoheptulose 7-phosphate isomerase
MKEKVKKIYEKLFVDYPALGVCRDSVAEAYEILKNTYENGGKLLVCGNGGSAADCEHIVGELMKGFHLKRPLAENEISAFSSYENGEEIAKTLQKGLPAISLVSHTGLMTAYINDCDADSVFAQQVYGYMNEGDALIALSTSGNSENVVRAAITAKAKGGKVIAFTGANGGKMLDLCETVVRLPSNDTAQIQEYTLPLYHCLCAMLEEEFFG